MPSPPLRPALRGVLQRKCACGGSPGVTAECEECGAEKLSLQRSTRTGKRNDSAFAPPIVHEVLNSSGRSLDQHTRHFMESRFGDDFNAPRVNSALQASSGDSYNEKRKIKRPTLKLCEQSLHTLDGKDLNPSTVVVNLGKDIVAKAATFHGTPAGATPNTTIEGKPDKDCTVVKARTE